MKIIKTAFCVVLALVLMGCAKTVKVYYPKGFWNEEDMKTVSEQFKNAEGVKKVEVGDDNSLTLLLTKETYDKQFGNIKNVMDSLNSEESKKLYNDVKNVEFNEERTYLEITVPSEVSETSGEVELMIYYMRMYKVYNLEPDDVIEVAFKDPESKNIYKTEKYNSSGKIEE